MSQKLSQGGKTTCDELVTLKVGLYDGFLSVANDVTVDLAARLKEGRQLLIKEG